MGIMANRLRQSDKLIYPTQAFQLLPCSHLKSLVRTTSLVTPRDRTSCLPSRVRMKVNARPFGAQRSFGDYTENITCAFADDSNKVKESNESDNRKFGPANS